jgi:DNA-binding response OmpR family regulator
MERCETMQGTTIVVIEDDDSIADLLGLYLDQAGFRVSRAVTGEDGLTLVAAEEPGLVVVDIGLPGSIDGFEVCRRLRTTGEVPVPVLILSARGHETDRVVGLELGADDYVTKPFSPRELVARVKAILRRTMTAAAADDSAESGAAPEPDHTIVLGDVTVDLRRREVRRGDEPIELVPRELDLLAALVEHRGQVLSRRQLLDLGWGYDWYGDERTVDVHVAQLRRKLGKDFPLATLRRAGYRLG